MIVMGNHNSTWPRAFRMLSTAHNSWRVSSLTTRNRVSRDRFTRVWVPAMTSYSSKITTWLWKKTLQLDKKSMGPLKCGILETNCTRTSQLQARTALKVERDTTRTHWTSPAKLKESRRYSSTLLITTKLVPLTGRCSSKGTIAMQTKLSTATSKLLSTNHLGAKMDSWCRSLHLLSPLRTISS